jgi:hypothetical protein
MNPFSGAPETLANLYPCEYLQAADSQAAAKIQFFVIAFTVNVHGESRRLARRGISLFLKLNR